MFKNLLCALAFAGLVTPALAQNGSPLPRQVSTSRSASHINIPGTKVFLVAPAGFTPSKSLQAIEKGKTGLIQVMELQTSNFYADAALFTRANLEAKGMKVQEFRDLTWNGYPAKLSLMVADAETSMYNLSFGDSTFSEMVVGLYPTKDTATGAQIRQSLMSVYYDKNGKTNPLDVAAFRIDESKSRFKFSQYAASMYAYTINGVKKNSYEGEPYLLMMTLPSSGQNMQAMCDNLAVSLKPYTERNRVEGKTNGYPSFRRELYSQQNGKPMLMFQHAVLIGESVVIMQGIAQSDFETDVADFLKLTNTVKRR